MPINPKLVHVYKLSDAVEGRKEGAWVFQYHGESFLTDPDGANPEPFAWADQPHEDIDFERALRRRSPACCASIRQSSHSSAATIPPSHRRS